MVKGMERVYELRNTYPIAAVNLSTSGGKYDTNCDTVYGAVKAMADNLRSLGIASVSGSGNYEYMDGISGPACVSSVVSVGATDSADAVAYFSDSASFLNLLAPGVSILSSIPDNGYATWNGTSMAAPHVTGAWAVLKQARPAASVNDILYALVSTGVSVTDYRNGLSIPRVRLDLALQKLAGSLIYYMPFFATDPANPTYCWAANKSVADVAASIQIMSGSSGTLPTQMPLSKTISIPARGSRMITFGGTAITSGSTSIDISPEVGSGNASAYSADITFTSAVAINCRQLEVSCFQGTTYPKRNLVGYTCYDGSYRNY
jgi:hypothetical protein